MVATPERSSSTDETRLVVQAEGGQRVDLAPIGDMSSADLLNADFRQIGDDLLLTPPRGQEIVIKDYFADGNAPDLLIDGRARLDGALVEKLVGNPGPLQVAENNLTATDQPGQLAQAGEPIGNVASVSGTVSVQRADGSESDLAEGDPIFLHDVVQASGDGQIGIVFIDGTTFSLSNGARMTMDEMVYDPATGGGNFVSSVLQGSFIFNTGSIAPSGNMEVNTPVGTIGIRGTTVAARLALEGSDTIIMLLPDEDGHVGRIFIRNAGGIQEITEANAAVTVTSFFIAPSTPVVMSGTEVLQYFDDMLQHLRQIQGVAPADEQGGSTEEGADGDQALLDAFDPEGFSTAAGGEMPEGQPGELVAVDQLSALLGFVPDPLAPVTFLSVSLYGNVGLGSFQYGSANYSPGGITLDYLDPNSGLPIAGPGSPFTFFTGGAGNDVLDASQSPGRAVIVGSAGDDVLTGSPFDDLVMGNAGNDLIIAGHGGGNDIYDGGDDIDTVTYPSADQPVIIDLTKGTAYGDPDIGVDEIVNIENAKGGSGNDVIIGNGLANHLDGNAGDDQISGLGGDDTIDGNQGIDTAVFTGKAVDYDIVFNTEGGYIEVTDARLDGDGTDILYNIEKLRFSDQEAWVSDLEVGLNQAPTDIVLANASIAENAAGAVVGAITVPDPDAGDSHIFQLSDARFEIVGGELRLKEGISLDFEAEASIDLTIVATDTGGLTHTKSFTLSLEDRNEAPAAPIDKNIAANLVSENAAAGTAVGIAAFAADVDAGDKISYALSDDAGGRFTIDENGIVRVADGAALDFEDTDTFDVTVTATDKGGLTSNSVFTIQLSDAQEPLGAVTDANAADNQMSEDAAAGSVVGIAALALDPDKGDSVTYSLSDDAGGRFSIDAATGEVKVVGGLDFETAESHQIVVEATSSDGSKSSESFTVAVTNANDNAVLGPVDTNDAANLVDENAGIGIAVGITASASDADKGASISYTLSDNAGGRFAIDAVTGIVTVAGALDYESATSHQITVLATSSDGSADSETFTVDIGNVADVPVAVDDTTALAIDALNTVTHGVNLLANDDIGIDTPGAVTAVQIGGGGFTAISAGGTDFFVKADGSLGSAGDHVGTLHVDQDGSWSFLQSSGSDAADLTFVYRVSDANGDTDTASFSVDLHDPVPVNYNDVTSTGADNQQNNILIVLDCSGSMHAEIGGTTRFELTKAALANMLSQYDLAGDVNVMVVGFSGDATAMSAWGDPAAALAFIDNLDVGGRTNYATGINTATNILNSATLQSQLLGGPTTVYFLSDGDPSIGTDLATNTAIRNAWDSALTTHVDRVVAVAVGSDILVTDPDLADVANPNGGGSPANQVIQVNNFSDLSAALASTTASASGNVLDGTLTAGNGDGGVAGVTPDKSGDPVTRLASFSYIDPVAGNGTNSLAISWNGVAATVTGAATGQVIANANGIVTFATNAGVMTFFFVDSGQRLAGDFTFTANAASAAQTENFHYATIDGNNDLDPDGGANLTIHVPVDLSLKIVPVMTNYQPGSLSAPQTGNSNPNTLNGDAGNNRLDGVGGGDTLNGNDGNDWLIGGTGTDTLNGGGGNDYLDGGSGNDAMAGGAGNDTYIVDSAGDTVTEAPDGGHDIVFASTTYTLSNVNVEDLVLTGTGNIDGTGNAADNQLYGNAGNNNLSGADGNDYLAGGAGNDTLGGGGGNDFLSGGAGRDVMTGGAGSDLFHNQAPTDNYSVGGNVAVSSIDQNLYDRVTDFDAAVDKIVFAAGYDGADGWDAGHIFAAGVDFSTITGSYDGTNGTSADYAAGKASLILDGDNNLIYDANGSAAGYTIVAQIDTTGGSPAVTADNVTVA